MHTPGPWTIEYTDEGIETSVCGLISARFKRDNEAMRVEAEANARLIAAALTMFQALEAVEWYYGGESGDGDNPAECLRCAGTRATGHTNTCLVGNTLKAARGE